MLALLRFRTGRTVSAEREHVLTVMDAAGLDPTEQNLQRGLDAVAKWIRDGKREVSRIEIEELVASLGLRRVDPAAVFVVQAIDRDPHPEDATVAVDWVQHYDGDEARQRVQPRDPAAWEEMEADLRHAAAQLEAGGWRTTIIRGALRQATFFRVGAALPQVRHHSLRYRQGAQLWSTDAGKAAIPAPTMERRRVNAGEELAVVVGITLNATPAAESFVRAEQLPVRHILSIAPGTGPDDQAIASPGQAVAYAQQIRDLVRAEVDGHGTSRRVHLFLAGPGGLALFLGHRWNRLPTTVVYEHLGAGQGYAAAFTIEM
jgi:hypothetical protein